MVNLTIDNINVSVPEGTTIMDAAKMADIPIPKPLLSERYQRDPQPVVSVLLNSREWNGW